ncbi:glucose 1-dehydrogenase [Acuticoccus yangtzensis]|uniref:glucose 1-dehydrogenase n=1 Tax=Acuticoccus yangtzensis TaxID=1443441 RepID=UPI0009498E6F|nr:glucose 1-dehydrogenase [Acuticoccus yangtzensis]ORE93173.1 short-chain dehydrogenase/reductase SDR [Stappia sp. 22II-S9-Z10]
MSQAPERFLADQTAIVTGASSGLGQACAIALAARGAAVAVNYRSDADGAADTIREIEAAGGKAFPFKADISQEEDIKALFAATVETYGTVDILVANAGLQMDGAFTDLTKKDWDTVIGVNLTGAFLCMQEAVRQFRKQGMRSSRALGKIIAMSSVHDVIPWAGHVNYAASKGGLSMLMKSAAQELAAEKIRVNAIAPGAIATAINKSVWGDEEKYKELLKIMPYGRIGETRDVGEACAWMASDYADYMTGHTLVIDGGMELYPEFIGNG